MSCVRERRGRGRVCALRRAASTDAAAAAHGVEGIYPTVGIDAHQRVELNVGERPFAFDQSKLPTVLLCAQIRSPLGAYMRFVPDANTP